MAKNIELNKNDYKKKNALLFVSKSIMISKDNMWYNYCCCVSKQKTCKILIGLLYRHLKRENWKFIAKNITNYMQIYTNIILSICVGLVYTTEFIGQTFAFKSA